MSLAKVHLVKKARKDQGKCGHCGIDLVKGNPYIHFTVGYRGPTFRRCTKPECAPLPSERESSLVASVYAAQEEFSLDGCDTLDAIKENITVVAEAAREIGEQYESNNNDNFNGGNSDLQERADTLNNYADELEGWEPDSEEPEEENWDAESYETFEEAHQAWLDEAKQSAESVVNETELP